MNNIKDYIKNKFYKKRVVYNGEEGKTRTKQISKSEAGELADAVFMLDPTVEKKYINSIVKSFLQESSDLYNWLIITKFNSNQLVKQNLIEFRKSLKFYDENQESFTEYEKVFNNFNSIEEFIDTVDEVKIDLDEMNRKENFNTIKQKELKEKKSKLNFLKDSSIQDGKLLLGTVDIYKNDFLNVFELNEISKFSKKENINYEEYIQENDIEIKSDVLTNFINSISKNDESFYNLAYDLINIRNGIYSIIDIEEELNEKSINSVDNFEEFKDSISVDSIFQYFSEFIPDVYEFFEFAIIEGNKEYLFTLINDLFKSINSGGKYTDEYLDTTFIIKVNKPFNHSVYVKPSDTKKLFEKDINSEIDESVISLNNIEDIRIDYYVIHNYLLQFDAEANKIMLKIEEHNQGKIFKIDYDMAKEYIKKNTADLKEKIQKGS